MSDASTLRKQATNKGTITTCLQSKWNAQGTRKKKKTTKNKNRSQV